MNRNQGQNNFDKWSSHLIPLAVISRAHEIDEMEKFSIASTMLSESSSEKKSKKLKSLHILTKVKRIKTYPKYNTVSIACQNVKIIDAGRMQGERHKPLQVLEMKQSEEVNQNEKDIQIFSISQNTCVSRTVNILEPAVVRQNFILAERDSCKTVDLSATMKRDEKEYLNEFCDEEVPSITIVDIIKMVETE
ncbi:hypothetical protein G9A89_023405 [Geosiphon pyriformis]|nr:hypothetical protein G9A89_023405 [Geosiphon pyriformis]